MKKRIIFLIMVSACFGIAEAQYHASGTAGYGWIQKGHEDGQYRYTEARFLFNVGSSHIGLGAYMNGSQYSGQFDQFLVKNTEVTAGISIDQWGGLSYSKDFYWWLNAGPKFSDCRGANLWFDRTKHVASPYVFAGFIISDVTNARWFSDHKFMVNETRLVRFDSINANYLSVRYEPTVYRAPIGRFFLEPRLIFSYENESWRQDYLGVGAGITFSAFKDWKREILTLNYRAKGDLDGLGKKPSHYFEASLDIINLFNVIF